MPCYCSSHKKTRKCGCKNILPNLEDPLRKQKLQNHAQRVFVETQNAPSFDEVQNDGTKKSGPCCKCNKKLNDENKTSWDEEGYHSASVSVNQLHKPEEHDRRYNRRNKLRELLIESELEPILENALPDSVENKLEPEVLATALLSEDEEIDLGSIRPEEVFKKLFLGSSSEVESSAPNSQNIQKIPVVFQGQSVLTLDARSSDQEPQRLRASSTPLRNDNQNSKNLDVPTFISPITNLDSTYDKNESQIVNRVLKPKTPLYGNRVQLYGSVKPSWFPGFTVVSPLIPECVKITSDPTEGLREAWRLCQPRHFDEVSKSLVNTG